LIRTPRSHLTDPEARETHRRSQSQGAIADRPPLSGPRRMLVHDAVPCHCRLPVPLRSTSSRQWRRKASCTNILPGPLSGGRS
jgi:hypothetical protein